MLHDEANAWTPLMHILSGLCICRSNLHCSIDRVLGSGQLLVLEAALGSKGWHHHCHPEQQMPHDRELAGNAGVCCSACSWHLLQMSLELLLCFRSCRCIILAVIRLRSGCSSS